MNDMLVSVKSLIRFESSSIDGFSSIEEEVGIYFSPKLRMFCTECEEDVEVIMVCPAGTI